MEVSKLRIILHKALPSLNISAKAQLCILRFDVLNTSTNELSFVGDNGHQMHPILRLYMLNVAQITVQFIYTRFHTDIGLYDNVYMIA